MCEVLVGPKTTVVVLEPFLILMLRASSDDEVCRVAVNVLRVRSASNGSVVEKAPAATSDTNRLTKVVPEFLEDSDHVGVNFVESTTAPTGELFAREIRA